MSRYSKWLSPLFFVLGISVVSISFYHSAGDGLRQYETMHLKSISREIREIVRAKQLELETKLSTYTTKQFLPDAASAAFNAHKPGPLNELLGKLQSEAGVDLAAMSDPVSGEPICGRKLLFVTPTFRLNQTGAAFFPVEGSPFLLAHAPVKLYGVPEGVLILGYDLNETVSAEIRAATGAAVMFSFDPPEDGAAENLEIVTADGKETRVYLEKDTRFVNEVRSRSELLFMVALGLSLFLLSYIFYRTHQGTVEFAKGYARAADEVLHDLRGPSNALKELLPLLIESRDPELLEVAKSRVERIEAITDSLAKRKREHETLLPSFTKSLQKDRIDLREIVEKQVQESRMRFTDVAFSIEDSEPVFIAGEKLTLERVLSNLVSNAAESVAETENKFVSVAISNRNRKLQLTVADTGAGISAKVLPHVFERGFTHGKNGGHGIGLAYVKDAVTGLGGTVEIVSSPGEGTTVLVEFPAVNSANEAENV
ncbi:MAG: HAMP domain-containing histidine kinase [Bdellovibrionaceae bacterium]|nr:HAMP domain-containing histidine kinase [Pseudobdellovibrionaceae bacterium]